MSRLIRFSTGVRAYSQVPYESVPRNRYNAKRSAFNLKPNPTHGLVHNPPASAPSLKKTPRPFLPAKDPRISVLADTYKVYSPEELQDMPLIVGYSQDKDYSVDGETALKIQKLRDEDPSQWTISRLAKEFGISQKTVNVIAGTNIQRRKQLDGENLQQMANWSKDKMQAREDRRKRVQMWLRNEY